MLIVNTCMASTMVMGVNHVNLSTNLKNPAANTNARVSYPVPSRVLQGPHYRTKARSMTHIPSLEEQYLWGSGDTLIKPCYGCYARYVP